MMLLPSACQVSVSPSRGERFMAADVFNILQHRAIREHIQRVTVFKVNVVQQGLHLTVVIDNHINALVLGRIGAGRAASRHAKRCQQRYRMLFS